MLDEYGVHPWQMDRWTGTELRDLFAFHERKVRAEQQRRAAEEG